MVNFDLPNVQEDYVHRIGRTGRAGVSGQAVSLVSADEYKQLIDIEYVIQQHIPRRVIQGFSPVNELEESRAIKPLKKKKPKKPKKTNLDKVEHKDGQKSSANARGHKPKSKNVRHQVNNGKSVNHKPASKSGDRAQRNNRKPNRNKQP